MKKNRHVVSVLVVLVSILFLSPQVFAEVINDNNGPVISNTSLNQSEYSPGDTVIYKFTVTDPAGISKIQDTILTANGLYVNGTLTNLGDNYTYTYKIPANPMKGNWQIRINAFDAYNNETYLGTNILIVGGISDNDGPVISNTSLNQSEYSPGDTVIFKFTVTDPAGISKIQDTILTANGLYVSGTLTNLGDNYTYTYKIPASPMAGNWQIRINAFDAYNNETYLGTNILIAGGISDNNGPVISNTSLNQSEYSPGDTVIYKFTVTDPDGISKIQDTILTANGLYVSGTLTNIGDNYTYTYKIPASPMAGNWEIRINAFDKYHNETYLGTKFLIVDDGTDEPTDPTDYAPVATYQTHVQNVGWQDYVFQPTMSGTEGRGLRLEGIRIGIDDNAGYNIGLSYQTHIENIGWESEAGRGWKSTNEFSGTEGLGYRLEAIQIKLTGTDADLFDIYYRVHAQNVGWMGWAKNGESAGTAGYGYRLEGIEIEIVPAGANAPGSAENAFIQISDVENY